MSDSSSDTIVIYDRSGRRRFIRNGAAFLLTGGAIVSAGPTLAADCDNAPAPSEKIPKQAGNGSDADAGANADPQGCGRRKDKPKITRLHDTEESQGQTGKAVKIVTVSG